MYLVCKNNPKFEETKHLIQAATELGIEVSEAPWDVYAYYLGTQNFFVFGTRPFVLDWVNDEYHIFSGQEYIYDYSFLLSIFKDKTSLFNPDCEIIPASYFGSTNGSRFIRPLSGNKSFTGQVVDPLEIRTNLSFQFNICPWELIVSSSPKKQPSEEYRFFFIRNNYDDIKYLACRYLPNPILYIPTFVVESAINYATKIFDSLTVGNSFVLDLSYDVKYKNKLPVHFNQLDETCKIIELNSWNSSGYYCINPKSILELLLENEKINLKRKN